MAKHRRKILRRCTESDTHANTFSDSKRDSYTDGNCNANGNCNADRYTHGYSELHAQVSTDAAAAPHAGTSTVMDGVSLQAGFGHGNQVLKT